MDLLDRLLGHDAWTTQQLLMICGELSDEQLDREFDIGHRTLRSTLNHVVRNMEVWSTLMAGVTARRESSASIAGMLVRLDAASKRLADVARTVADRDAWDETWLDDLEDPPRRKSYGTAIAHVLTHSMHHRAQVLYMLRLTGVEHLPEGDVFSWEREHVR
ncbi:DinB family protein [Caulifigura coniformis]|nr:DinB family protein [Caulifigura coniformis]